MPYASLKTLQQNPSYKKLIDLQANLDVKDTVLANMPMTRSPQHILAFLIAWSLTTQDSKAAVVKSLNDYQHTTFTIEELDSLTSQIEWDSFFADLKRVYGILDYLEVELPESCYQHVSNERSHNKLYEALFANNLVEKSDDPFTFVLLTTVKQQVEWLEPMIEVNDYPTAGKKAWRVASDVFKLHPDFIEELNRFGQHCSAQGGQKMEKTFGSFTVTAYETQAEADANSYRVYIAAPKDKDSFDLKVKKTSIAPGVYQAFVGTQFVGMSDPIDNVVVNLKGKASFDRVGAQAQQTQEVIMECGCAMPVMTRKMMYEICINDVHALFENIQLGANFSTTPQSQDDQKPVKLSLLDKQRHYSVELASKPYSVLDIVGERLHNTTPVSHSFLLKLLSTPTSKAILTTTLIVAGLACLVVGGIAFAGIIAALSVGAAMALTLSGAAIVGVGIGSSIGFFANKSAPSTPIVQEPSPAMTPA